MKDIAGSKVIPLFEHVPSSPRRRRASELRKRNLRTRAEEHFHVAEPRKTVLAVDDDRVFVELLWEKLRHRYHVIAAFDGLQAIEAYLRWREHIHLIVTGLTDESVQLSAKRMQLLKEAVPKAALIAVLWNADDQGMTLRYRGIEKAARFLHVEVEAFGVREPDDFAGAFSAMTRRRPDALFLVADPMTFMNRKRVIEFAATNRISAMYELDFFVRDGGLMSYGPSYADSFRRAAFYIDRIFKGAKPADLPAEQPMRYYLTVNFKTAAALGLTLPPSLLLRTDEVVQ